MPSKPTQRTLKELRENGWTCHIVEKWNSFAKIRQDFGGFGDILAYKPGRVGVLAIQTCADNGGDVQRRVTKLTPLANVTTWLQAGNRLEIWGWGLRGARGKKKEWTLRIVPLTIENIEERKATPQELAKCQKELEPVLPF